MNIEVLLTEAEIAEEFAEAMEARDLPEKFFYWLPLSVKAWRELSGNDSYRALDRTWDLVGGRADDLVAGFPPVIPVVSLGAGDGNKDRALIQAIRRTGRSVKYFPVDASQTLLEIACAAAEEDEVEVMGIKADISSPMHVVLASDAAESPKLYLISGNTLGGFDPMDQIRHIAETMKGGDRLILDAEIYRKEDAAPGTEDARVAKFAFAPLASLGVQEDDGQIRFESKRDERHAGMHLITKYFQAHRDLRISVGGQEIALARGERVFMNFRYLFTPEAFRWLLKEHAGLQITMELFSSDGAFVTAICSCS
ncbi:MAG: L-histidine N(alpha)-methyltransferase [Acidobacteriota bacterium]|nr:L-histidine N(alpha)-methyltransferase [Acidobacteriota bacterium]